MVKHSGHGDHDHGDYDDDDDDDETTAMARQHRIRSRIEESDRNKRRLQRVIIMCFIFFIIEIIGGLVAGSLALMRDAFHLLSGVPLNKH